MPITISCSPQWLDSKPACCPGQVSHFSLKLALTCRNTFVDAHRQGSLVYTETHAHLHKQFFFNPHTNCFISFSWVRMRCFWSLYRDKGELMMGHMLQFLSAVSHLIICPKDITVYLPALMYQVSTCLPATLPVPWCVCGHFQGVGVLSWRWETVSWQADQACWRAWRRGDACIVRPGVHTGVCVCVLGRKKETRREREDDSKGSRNEMTDFS